MSSRPNAKITSASVKQCQQMTSVNLVNHLSGPEICSAGTIFGAVQCYRSSDSGGVSSGSLPSSRISVSSNSVMVITPGTGASITSMVVVSTTGVIGGFGLAFLRAGFFAPGRLASAATPFFGLNLAVVRLAALPRRELEDLRAVPRTVDFRFRTVTRFLRWAMIAAYADQRRKESKAS
jgi:hypothetical protein